MGLYVILINEKKEYLNLKLVTMFDPVTGFSQMTQYNNKHEIKITNLVGTTWLTRHPCTTRITVDQVSEFIGYDFRK